MPRPKVLPKPTRTELERLIDDYLADVRARGLSRKTEQHYASVLHRQLLPWAERHGITQPAQLDQKALNQLSTELLNVGSARGPLSRFSVRSYLTTVNHMLSWAAKQGELEAVKAQVPRTERRVLDVLNREEIRRLEDAAGSERDKLIVRLLADTGLRAGELTGLRLDDLLQEGRDRFLKVRGKGRRERLVPVAPQVFTRLRRYADRTRPQDADTDRIFVSLRRLPRTGQYEALEVSGLGQLVRELGAAAGIKKRVHTHLLRHSFVTWALRRGMNPVTVATIVGHADLAMIARTYSHLNQQDAAAALMRALRED
jgi:integrase